MKGLSLFSGIGGFDLAMERAGIKLVGMCEIDKNAQNVLRRRFPNVKLYDDVRKVGKETHERGSVDVICGGFPCQDLSIAGKRAGLAGERSGLWFEFARIIDELEPSWVVIENVPGLLSSNKGADLAVILQFLEGADGLMKRETSAPVQQIEVDTVGVEQRRAALDASGTRPYRSAGNERARRTMSDATLTGTPFATHDRLGEELLTVGRQPGDVCGADRHRAVPSPARRVHQELVVVRRAGEDGRARYVAILMVVLDILFPVFLSIYKAADPFVPSRVFALHRWKQTL